MADKNWVEKATAQIAEMTPRTGFNVVAVDRMERPGEALYLVNHFTDEGKAEAARAAHEAKSGDKSYVYSSNTKTNASAMK